MLHTLQYLCARTENCHHASHDATVDYRHHWNGELLKNLHPPSTDVCSKEHEIFFSISNLKRFRKRGRSRAYQKFCWSHQILLQPFGEDEVLKNMKLFFKCFSSGRRGEVGVRTINRQPHRPSVKLSMTIPEEEIEIPVRFISFLHRCRVSVMFQHLNIILQEDEKRRMRMRH